VQHLINDPMLDRIFWVASTLLFSAETPHAE